MRDSDYYIWLNELTGNHPDYQMLIKHLDGMTYRWIFALDENRFHGGINLRHRYAGMVSVDVDDVRTGPCSVLEMLLGLADHMQDQLEGCISDWFWVMVGNLHLLKFNDDHFDPRGVDYLVNSWLNHNYQPDGEGSIFPLKDYAGDCRNIDLWSQMNAWILENYPSDDSWLN